MPRVAGDRHVGLQRMWEERKARGGILWLPPGALHSVLSTRMPLRTGRAVPQPDPRGFSLLCSPGPLPASS